MKQKKQFYKKWWFWLVVVIVVIGMYGDSLEDENVGDKDKIKEEIEQVSKKEDKSETEELDESQSVKEIDEERSQTQDDKMVAEELNRKDEIREVIESRINEGEYRNSKLEKIAVNENLGTDIEDDYIALVYFKLDIKNRKDTGNKVMKMFSDDLVATLAKKGTKDVVEAVVFWEDEYNNRTVKYAYEYKNGGFHITDIAGE